ncbi:MAG: hypothetical protein R3E97_09730 [Candidatus Eisenbacteria bacterium]
MPDSSTTPAPRLHIVREGVRRYVEVRDRTTGRPVRQVEEIELLQLYERIQALEERFSSAS